MLPQIVLANAWDNLWFNKNQQGAKLLQESKNQDAANTFEDKNWKGIAYYRAGNYESAYNEFKHDNSAEGLYNQANSLAHLQKYKEAIAAYDKAIKAKNNNQDAIYNKELVEKLLKEQEQSQNSQDKQSNDKQSQQQQQNYDKKDSNKNDANKDNKQQSGADNNKDSNQNKSSQDKSSQDKSSQDKSSQNNSKQNNSEQNKQQPGDNQNQTKNDSNQGKDNPQKNQQNSTGNKNQPTDGQNGYKSAQTEKNAGQTPEPAKDKMAKPSDSNDASNQTVQNNNTKPDKDGNPAATSAYVKPETPEDKEVKAALSQIPDDPGGLLRNKFLRDYQGQQNDNSQ